MAKVKRKQVFVDPKVQGALLLRVATYWVLCLLATAVLLLSWQVLKDEPAPFLAHLAKLWNTCGPVFLASLVLLPVVVTDIVRLSNRFCGPLVRVRDSLRRLAAGEDAPPLQFRREDFWWEIGEEVNAVAAYLRCQKTDQRAAQAWSQAEQNRYVNSK